MHLVPEVFHKLPWFSQSDAPYFGGVHLQRAPFLPNYSLLVAKNLHLLDSTKHAYFHHAHALYVYLFIILGSFTRVS